jgi:hypothetical protein
MLQFNSFLSSPCRQNKNQVAVVAPFLPPIAYYFLKKIEGKKR